MNKLTILLIILSITSVYSISLFNKQCTNKVAQLQKSFLSALKQQDSNQLIDKTIKVLQDIPNTLISCNAQKQAEIYSSEIPQVCINDLKKAFKLLAKALDDQQNQVKFALDLVILEKMFKTKLQKQCPFLKDVTLQDIKSSAQCMESSYQLSRIFQLAWQDYKADNKQKALDELTSGIQLIPDTLNDCGQVNLANKLRRFMNIQCMNAAQDFIKEGIVFLHNFDKFQWLVKHAQDLINNFKSLEKACSGK